MHTSAPGQKSVLPPSAIPSFPLSGKSVHFAFPTTPLPIHNPEMSPDLKMLINQSAHVTDAHNASRCFHRQSEYFSSLPPHVDAWHRLLPEKALRIVPVCSFPSPAPSFCRYEPEYNPLPQAIFLHIRWPHRPLHRSDVPAKILPVSVLHLFRQKSGIPHVFSYPISSWCHHCSIDFFCLGVADKYGGKHIHFCISKFSQCINLLLFAFSANIAYRRADQTFRLIF